MSVSCSKCRKAITGQFIKIDSRSFHPNCLRCHGCGKSISGGFQEHKRKFYHPDCHQWATGMICAGCGKVLGPQWVVLEKKNYHQACFKKASPHHCVVCNEGIVGSYITDAWGHKAHSQHPGPCSSCGRILSKKHSKLGSAYDDGRFICGLCERSAMYQGWGLNRAKRKVLKLLESAGFHKIPLNVPVALVDQDEFNRKTNQLHVKGLTISQGTASKLNHKIYILYGLPKAEFMGVLAHELLHVWQNEHGFKMSSRSSEGLCNLASYWFYETEASELSGILMDRLKKNEDPIYGDGFRLMLKRWEKLGWNKFVTELLNNKAGVERSLWSKIFG